MVWGDVVVTSHFEGRSMCVSWNDRSTTHQIGIHSNTLCVHTPYRIPHDTIPRTRRFEFFVEGSKAHRERKTPLYIYIWDLYMLHYEHAVRIEDVRKSILRV